jgi:hypothetical protein
VTTYPHPKTNGKRKFFAAFALLTGVGGKAELFKKKKQ